MKLTPYVQFRGWGLGVWNPKGSGRGGGLGVSAMVEPQARNLL